MCNCEIINGSRFVCDSCRKAMSEHLSECYKRELDASRESVERDAMRDRLARAFPSEACRKATYYVINEQINWDRPARRMSVEGYLALVFAEMD